MINSTLFPRFLLLLRLIYFLNIITQTHGIYNRFVFVVYICV